MYNLTRCGDGVAQTSEEESLDWLVERFNTMLSSDSRMMPDLSFLTALQVVSDPEHVEAQSVQLLLNHLPHTTRVNYCNPWCRHSVANTGTAVPMICQRVNRASLSA
jgi:hypothetical protein